MKTKEKAMKFREFFYLVHAWFRSLPIGEYCTIRHILRRQKDFKYIELLGDGKKGVVVAAEVKDELVAVKIVNKTKISNSEEDIWPQLSHPNISRFLQRMQSSCNSDFVFYIMVPATPITLEYILCDRRIRRGDGSLCVRSKWFRQLLQAISYLHETGVCHLHITPDNILVTTSSNLVLTDFGEARRSSQFIPTNPCFDHLKPVYRPPEIYKRIKVNGEKCDLWNFGIIVIESITHFIIDRKAPKAPKPYSQCTSELSYSSILEEYWDCNLRPFFLNILHERNFTSLVKLQCVNIRLYALEFRQLLNFLGLFMTPEPEDRISAKEALAHPFMLGVRDISFHVGDDFIGKRKGPDGFYNNDCNLPRRRYKHKIKPKAAEIYRSDSIWSTK